MPVRPSQVFAFSGVLNRPPGEPRDPAFLEYAVRPAASPWESGIVLAGWSAGSLCWHRGGPTDSFGDSLAGWSRPPAAATTTSR